MTRHTLFDTRPPSRAKVAFAIILLLALWGWASSMDYADARMQECADQSTAAAIGYWNPEYDSCEFETRKPKEPR